MTVGELIKQLEEYPKDLEVVVYDDEYDESRIADASKQTLFKVPYRICSGHYYKEKCFEEFGDHPVGEVEVVVFS